MVEAVITVIALLFLLFVVLGAYATVKVIGAAKRGVDRTISRPAARSRTPPCVPRPSLSRARRGRSPLTLRTSMRATQDAPAPRRGRGRVPEGVPGAVRATQCARARAGRRAEAPGERSRTRGRSPRGSELRERTERITQSADSLRWAARDRARRFAADDLDSLSEQIDVEAGALRHWTTEPGPTASWPEAPVPDMATSSGQTWPEPPQSRPADEPPPSAITPPVQRPTYPWQKKPRPREHD